MEPVTLITGGSSGIGAATARVLLKQGHRVAITGRDADRLAAFAASAGAGERLLTISGDASDENHVAAAVRQVADSWDRLDTVIANAGFSLPGTLEDHDPQAMREWAAHALAENVRLLVAKDRIRVTLVAPGVVDTPFWDERGGSPAAAPTLTAEQIAEAILFAINQPEGVDINHLILRPTGQQLTRSARVRAMTRTHSAATALCWWRATPRTVSTR